MQNNRKYQAGMFGVTHFTLLIVLNIFNMNVFWRVPVLFGLLTMYQTVTL